MKSRTHFKSIVSWIFLVILIFIGIIAWENRKTGVAEKGLEKLSFCYEDSIEYSIHPFLTDSGYYLVVPSFWNTRSISVVRDLKNNNINDGNIVFNSSTGSINEQLGLKSSNLTIRQSKLPSVLIQTDLGDITRITKTEKDGGHICIIGSNGEVEYNGPLSSIKGRGNTTWLQSNKKPYSIKLAKKSSVFGWKKGKKFNLLADAFDSTKLRNWLALNLAKDFGIEYPIHCQHVALWVNGYYQGIYLFTEPVEVGKRGVNIIDLDKQNTKINGREFNQSDVRMFDSQGLLLPDTFPIRDAYRCGVVDAENPDDVTGGYVIEFMPWTKTIVNKFTTPYWSFSLRSPKYPTIEQMTYIQNRWAKVMEMVHTGDSAYANYLNVDSYARYYLLQEILYSTDACTGSVFHVKNRNEIDSLFYAAPAWDFDHSMGCHFGDWKNEVRSFQLRPSSSNINLIFPDLYNFQNFRDTVSSLYYSRFSPLLHQYFDSFKIDSMALFLSDDVSFDKKRWFEEFDYNEELRELKSFMLQRINYIDADLQRPVSEYYTINVDYDFFWIHSYQIHVDKGDSLELFPHKSYWKVLDYIEDDSGNKYDFEIVPKDNMNLFYRWRPASKIEKLWWKMTEWLEKW